MEKAEKRDLVPVGALTDDMREFLINWDVNQRLRDWLFQRLNESFEDDARMSDAIAQVLDDQGLPSVAVYFNAPRGVIEMDREEAEKRGIPVYAPDAPAAE